MQLHASCAARDGAGVLLVGAPGSGKSDLLLRLLDHGFALVADDRVDLQDGVARAPQSLAGLMEVRGLGILRLPFVETATIALAIEMGHADRMPEPTTQFGVPMLRIDPRQASAPSKVLAALRCALGQTALVAGALP